MTTSTAGLAFDRIAEQYDALWSESAVGRQQRRAVWQRIDPLFSRGSRVLDLGCGSGVDAVHLMQRGVDVTGIDASAGMVRVARARGVNVRLLAIEALEEIEGVFDGALSNFGALNCVPDLAPVAHSLGRLIRPGGYVALCVLGRCCAWEVAHFLRRSVRHSAAGPLPTVASRNEAPPGNAAKAFRRYRRGGCEASLGIRVHYHSAAQIRGAFAARFQLVDWRGIGVCVPPSYIDTFSERVVSRMGAVDRKLAHLPLLRALGDHRLFVFRRI
jgi:SAM-dependent methyltransferase